MTDGHPEHEMEAQASDPKDEDEYEVEYEDEDEDEDLVVAHPGRDTDHVAQERPEKPSEELALKRLEHLVKLMSKHPLFDGCGSSFILAALKKAERVFVATGEVVPLDDDGPLYIVETGVLEVRVGPLTQPSSAVSNGTVFNGAGFLELYKEAELFRPRRVSLKPDEHPCTRSARADGYDVVGYTGPPPSLFLDRRGPPAMPEVLAATGPPDSALCFFNLCPYATLKKNDRLRTAWMDAVFNGAPPGMHAFGRPEDGLAKEMLPTGGATLLALPPLKLLLELQRSFKSTSTPDQAEVGSVMKVLQAVRTFKSNCDRLRKQWKDLMAGMCTVFPGIHPEVVWSFTEVCSASRVSTGACVVCEDEVGEAGDAIIFITEGVAMVEKRGRQADVQCQEVIGRLRAGAIVGCLSFIGMDLPRPASVRAKTDVQAIRLGPADIQALMGKFPGVLEFCKDRLEEPAEYWKERLLTRTEVASSLNLFHGCNLRFINDIANEGERQFLTCGQPVISQGSTDGTLFVLELGSCSIEVRGVGKVAEVPAGNCFGERTLLGIASQANATVRVSTPWALVLSIPRSAMGVALKRHPEQQEHFERLKTQPMEGRVAGQKVRHVELFRPCGNQFLQCLNDKVQTYAYMPGQTIVVEGDIEMDPRMFVLTGGVIVAERNNKPLARMAPGATFGELAMLGLAKERAVTVRAVTLCFVMSIKSTAFFAALQKFPEEQDRFEQVLTDTHFNARVVWPCLIGQPTRLLYLLDLYGDKLTCPVGSDELDRPPFNEGAVLVQEGELQVENATTGDIICKLTNGMCYNEQILAGSISNPHVKFVPISVCQVRILTRETWEKVLAEFPSEQAHVRESIKRYMAEKAEKQLGFTPGSPGLLRSCCACLKFVSDSFAEIVRNLIETRIYEPGKEIARSTGSEGEEMFIILSGTATLKTSIGVKVLGPGQCLGEAVLLRCSRHYYATLRAREICIVQVLQRKALEAAQESLASLGVFEFQHLLGRLQKEVSPLTVEQLHNRLVSSSAFSGSSAAFVASLCRSPDITILPPGGIILEQGEICALGVSTFFLVLAGRVRVEGPFGTLYGMVSAGQVFGEVGAFGLAEKRTANIRAWEDGLVCCFRVAGDTIVEALKACPYAKEPLAERWRSLAASNSKTAAEREKWMKETVIPALTRTPLLDGCPESFLRNLAVQLCETTHNPGDVIARVGERFNSMLLLIKGSAQIESTAGGKVGLMTEGSVFGEANVLGLYHYAMATVRVTAHSVVVSLSDCGLREALKSKGDEAKEMREAFQALCTSRHEQVARGLPMTRLPINATVDDASVRAIALLSEQLSLAPGEVWQMMPDGNPCGAHFGIVIQGRLTFEMGPEHSIMTLGSGSVFPEGMPADYGGYGRAETYVEAYRIRRSDFEMAVSGAPGHQAWVWRFKLLEKDISERLRMRLNSTRGLIDSQKERRARQNQKAKGKKDSAEDSLPPVKDHSSDARRRYGNLSRMLANWPGLQWQHSDPRVYAAQLPRVKGRKGSLRNSQSVPSLPSIHRA